MRAVTEREIRASFVNSTKGEAKRMAVPRDLAERPWDDLDFLGWRDMERAYVVAEHGDGLVGVALRVAPPGRHRRTGMCAWCLTTHPGDGVALMTARKSARGDNSVGVYVCGDLDCSLHLRGRKDTGRRLEESLTLAEQIDRTTANVAAFLERVLAG
ncbi:FBP domain-containing protein [Actinophytocola oryzae]|uniref:Treble-clef zinc-finger protein n=1 Tax=Actinophytocola oryzae TaxID=502181 RepID=A0A4R7UZ24_9PSEU|nr:FBP domain-containing protein [Actinophytocola oryzae]TDV42183.1 treble-clef zinc-finger protein [Actinophytocola oryzae]